MIYKELKECMKKLCGSLREHVMNIINFKTKEKVINKLIAGISQNIVKLETVVIIQAISSAVDSICNSKDSLPKEFTITFHNGYNYGDHFIVKDLAK